MLKLLIDIHVRTSYLDQPHHGTTYACCQHNVVGQSQEELHVAVIRYDIPRLLRSLAYLGTRLSGRGGS